MLLTLQLATSILVQQEPTVQQQSVDRGNVWLAPEPSAYIEQSLCSVPGLQHSPQLEMLFTIVSANPSAQLTPCCELPCESTERESHRSGSLGRCPACLHHNSCCEAALVPAFPGPEPHCKACKADWHEACWPLLCRQSPKLQSSGGWST